MEKITMYFVGSWFILIGLYLIYTSLKDQYRIQNLLRIGVCATATIVEVLEEDEYYFMLLEYETLTGQVFKTKTRQDTISAGINNNTTSYGEVSAGLTINDQVEILYNPDNPQDIVVNTTYYKRTSGLLQLVLGGIIILAGIFIIRAY